ncbi:hypothetical protein A4A49_16307 [Nicotiana attenuata]|uniref:Uncharacterized protein n=1 Tax=Nicotiana attenuata TaxID=49451 RepID=A0A314LID1_NICAT|nr:hypothetical protein A4A49_16307 [Nicotiana attenuata]
MAQSSPQINTTTLAINQMNTNKPRHGNRANKVLAGVSNLLPTGTVLAFQTLMPSFTDGGSCLLTHKFLTGILIVLCAAACFFSSFTDSFLDENGKLYYGIAVWKGLHVFNCDEPARKHMKTYLEKYHISRKWTLFMPLCHS